MHDFTDANARYLEVPTPATTHCGPIRSFEGALHMFTHTQEVWTCADNVHTHTFERQAGKLKGIVLLYN